MAKQVISTGTTAAWTTGLRQNLSDQIRRSIPALGLAMLGVIIGCTPAVLLIVLRGVDPELLTRDIFVTTNAPIYTGFLSNLGLFGWSAAAAIWLLNALLMARIDLRHPQLLFAVGSMLFTTLLLFDDAFMFHEMVIPDYIGISEKKVMVIYALIALSYVGLNIRHILRSPYIILLIAVGLLSLSVVLDQVMVATSLETLFEDGFKFAGIIFWAVYAGSNAMLFVDEIAARR